MFKLHQTNQNTNQMYLIQGKRYTIQPFYKSYKLIQTKLTHHALL